MDQHGDRRESTAWPALAVSAADRLAETLTSLDEVHFGRDNTRAVALGREDSLTPYGHVRAALLAVIGEVTGDTTAASDLAAAMMADGVGLDSALHDVYAGVV